MLKAIRNIHCDAVSSGCYQFWCFLCLCCKRRQKKKPQETQAAYQINYPDPKSNIKQRQDTPDTDIPDAESSPHNAVSPSLSRASTQNLGSPGSGSPSFRRRPPPIFIPPRKASPSTRKPSPLIQETLPPISIQELKDVPGAIKRSEGMENLADSLPALDSLPTESNAVQRIIINTGAIIERPTSPGEFQFVTTPSSAGDRVVVESLAKKTHSIVSEGDSNSSNSSDSGQRLTTIEEQCFNSLNSPSLPQYSIYLTAARSGRRLEMPALSIAASEPLNLTAELQSQHTAQNASQKT